MRWLKSMISVLLVIAAAAVVLVTALSDHSDDYGQVPLPEGGVLQLPEGTVTVFYSQLGDSSDPIQQLSVPLSIQVTPVSGGAAVPVTSANDKTPEVATQRSETVGELGAVAKLHIPTAGAYMVSGTTNLASGSSFLKLGTNAGTAVVNKWHLLAGLLIAAFLLAIIPVPKGPRRWDQGDAPKGWSSDPRAPYAG
jgi:hypothetical protein